MPIGVIFRALTCTLVLTGVVLAQGLTPPPPSNSLQPSSGLAAVDRPSGGDGILVVGGTRRTGLEIVKLLRARGYTVTVMARHTSDVTALEALGVPVLRADALAASEVRQVILPGRYRAIISTLGAAGKEPKPDFEGNRNLIDAAKAAGVNRFLLVTVIGAGDYSESPPLLARWFL
jgi:nucleoside-diphosphate-sugar epimerase